MTKIPTWIDTDCGVDDALALVLALVCEKIDVVGVSAVAGNVELVNTFKNSRNVINLAGFSDKVKVYSGAAKPIMRGLETASEVHGADGLGGVVLENSKALIEKKYASDALYDASCEYEKELNVIAIGPLTNIAQTIMKYPDFKYKVKQILFMGGAVVGGNTTPCSEFNAYTDPEAMEVVLNAGIPLVMFGLDCTMKSYLTSNELNSFRTMNKVSNFIAECSQDILALYQKEINRSVVILHDSCPVIYLEHPEFFDGVMAGVHCETLGSLTRGKTVADIYTDTKFEEKNCFVMLDADRIKIVTYVFELLKKYNAQVE